jgi:hypothetical protein
MNGKPDKEYIVTKYVLADEFKDGSFVEVGDGDEFSDSFWDGVEVLTYHHQHIRVTELKGQIEYQYKFVDDRVYLRTLRYYLTSRPSNQYWNRANIDVQLESYGLQRVNSPDAMSQNAQWHTYVVNLSVARDPAIRAGLKIRVEYDGTNNGVGEHDSWGNVIDLVPR